MAEAKFVIGFTELPGPNTHKDFKFPWQYAEEDRNRQKDKRRGDDKGKDKTRAKDKETNETGSLPSRKLKDRTKFFPRSLTPPIATFEPFEPVEDPKPGSDKYGTTKPGSSPSADRASQPIKLGIKTFSGLSKGQSPRPSGEDRGHPNSSSSSRISKNTNATSSGTFDISEGREKLKEPEQDGRPVNTSQKSHKLEKCKSRSNVTRDDESIETSTQSQLSSKAASQKSSNGIDLLERSRKKYHYLEKVSRESGASSLTDILELSQNETLLGTLRRFETLFLIDDSASMENDGHWKMAVEVLNAVIEPALSHSPDGINIQFLNSDKSLAGVKSIGEIMDLLDSFQPQGTSTPTETRIEKILNDYLKKIENESKRDMPLSKPLNIIVTTDGVADDVHSLVETIRKVCKRLDAEHFPLNQVGIQFIQIGTDKRVTKQLRFLDDQLQAMCGVSRDIVDTTEYVGLIDQNFIIKCLLGGVNRQIDRARSLK